MHSTRAATRYAKSLLELASERGETEKVHADMRLIYQVCRTSREFVMMLKNPVLKADKKQKILSAIFKGKISVLTETFIRLLAAKRRETLLEHIALSFSEQYKQKKNILTAVITTASGIDEELRKKVLELVKTSADSEIELVENINEKLIGGFILQMGDRRIDASVAKQIRKLVMTFSENPYIKDY